MKKILIIFFLFTTLFLFSSKPKWAQSLGVETGYDKSLFVTGFGIANDNYDNAKASAINELSGLIKTNVVSNLEMREEEKNGDSLSYAKLNIQTSVYMDISGIKEYLKYYDDKEKRFYALCILDKKTFLNDLSLERKSLIEEYKSNINLINTYLDKKNTDKALEVYEDSNKTLEKLNQNFLISNYLKEGKEDLTDLFKLFEIKGQLTKNIKSVEILSMQELAEFIINKLSLVDFKQKEIAFLPAFYKSTKISSEFFYHLQEFANVILNKKQAVLKENYNENNLPDYIFKGSFCETNKGYKLIYTLSDAKQKKTLEIVEIDITDKFVESSGFKILPDNIKNAKEDDSKIISGTDNDSNLKIMIWTNKGSENLIFKKGEKVQFYIQTNQSGYVSILYHLAGDDRIKTPLIQNYYIPPENIYKPVKIDFEFEVYPPFGSETAQVFFSTEKIQIFKTVEKIVDGENYEVLADDFENFIKDFRGLKQKKKLQFVETYITITTIKQ